MALHFEEVRHAGGRQYQLVRLHRRRTTTMFGRVRQNAAPRAKSAIYDCLVHLVS